MLLVVDVGNTNTVFGVFRGAELVAQWRIETRRGRTADEYAALLRDLYGLSGLEVAGGGTRPGGWHGISAAIVATVVPPVLFAVEDFIRRHLGVSPLVVGPGLRSGMPILTESPRDVGADRIVNAVAAYERYHQGCVVVDFGTATTFDLVTPRGEYAGGAIAPGIHISADALYHAAARLPRVEITRPGTLVGKNTVQAMQAGLYYGYVGLVDEIVSRMITEAGFACRVLATGGLAPLIARDSRTIEESDEQLTLTGLRILYERNR